MLYRKYNKDILYYDCPRHFFKIIFKNLVKNTHLISDNRYLTNNKETETSKEYYQKFIIKLLNNLKRIFQVNAFIGFNFRYSAERELHAACTKSKIPFLVLHKESTATEYETKFISKVLRNGVGRYQGKKIGVYSYNEKKLLIKNKIANKNQINVIGCSRLDQSFKLRDKTPENQILYYIIDYHRGLPDRFFKIYGTKYFQELIDKQHTKNFSWEKQHLKILRNLKNFAIKNPSVKIILKAKQGDKLNKSKYRSKYYSKKVDDNFRSDRDKKIAHAVLKLFDERKNIEIFNKKALYILIREMTNTKTQHITKVVNVIKKDFTENFIRFQNGNFFN